MVDLLVLNSLDQLLFMLKLYFFYKTTLLDEEVNSTEPSPSVRVPLYWVNQVPGKTDVV